ncbi:MAG TPA: helix-hairpin-helix domain-containing protein [Candidatus Paceibacterota bacterium]
MKKFQNPSEAKTFTDIPNVGMKVAERFQELGLSKPEQLKGKDAFKLYQKLNALKGERADPCLLDTFIAAVDFMNGGNPKPWWFYTKERKRKHPNL